MKKYARTRHVSLVNDGLKNQFINKSMAESLILIGNLQDLAIGIFEELINQI